jgi:membrane protease YdiL (CAAX protease family)
MPQHQRIFGLLVFALLMGSILVWMAAVRRLLERRALVDYEGRLRVSWKAYDLVWLILAWPILEVTALRIVVGKVDMAQQGLSMPALAAVTAAHFLWVVIAIGYLMGRGVRPKELGFDTSRLRYDLRLGLLAFLAAAPLVYGVQILVSQFWTPQLHPLARLVTERPSGALMAVAALSAVVVAPLAEELLFRVLFQGWLERALRRRRAWGIRVDRVLPIVASALVFAAMHQGADRIALFVLALFLGFLYRQTHRIFPSLVVHACINALAIVGLWLGVE